MLHIFFFNGSCDPNWGTEAYGSANGKRKKESKKIILIYLFFQYLIGRHCIL